MSGNVLLGGGYRLGRSVPIKANVTGGEFDEMVGQLPRDYDDLLGTSPVQH